MQDFSATKCSLETELQSILSIYLESLYRYTFLALLRSFILLQIVAFVYIQTNDYLINSVVICLLGFFLYGPQTLLGVQAAELVDKKATGTVTASALFYSSSLLDLVLLIVLQEQH